MPRVNFTWPIFRKPEPIPHVVIRHVAATSRENREARAAFDRTRSRLERLTAGLSEEQRREAKARAGMKGAGR